jgi:hypothetical protein
MDDLAVARTGAGADRIRGFEDHDLAASHGKCTGDGEPDNPGSDYGTVDSVQGILRPQSLRFSRLQAPRPAIATVLPDSRGTPHMVMPLFRFRLGGTLSKASCQMTA